MTRVLGVDPGLTGGVALLDTAGDTLRVEDIPVIALARGAEISETLLAQLIRDMAPEVAWIERVASMPKQGVASTFKFGMGYGIARGVIGALGVPLFLVTPVEWKREFRLRADKEQSRVLACRMFPASVDRFSRKRDNGRAEASLIAVFGARQGF